MKKWVGFLVALLVFFGRMVPLAADCDHSSAQYGHPSHTLCNPKCQAPACGTECSLNIISMGIPILLVLGVAAVILATGENVHAH